MRVLHFKIETAVADHRSLASRALSEDVEHIGERSFRTFKVPLEEQGE